MFSDIKRYQHKIMILCIFVIFFFWDAIVIFDPKSTPGGRIDTKIFLRDKLAMILYRYPVNFYVFVSVYTFIAASSRHIHTFTHNYTYISFLYLQLDETLTETPESAQENWGHLHEPELYNGMFGPLNISENVVDDIDDVNREDKVNISQFYFKWFLAKTLGFILLHL